MAGYIGTKAVNLSTTAATVGGDADVSGALDVGGAFTSQGIDDNATSTAITIDSSENVGIGITPTAKLHLGGTNPNLVFGTSGNELTYLQRYNDDFYIFNKETTGSMLFGTANSEAMRLDASGNLLVGQTTASSNDVGFFVRPDGFGSFTRDGNRPLYLSRLTSDGEIVQFRKDSTAVGSIGVHAGNNIVIGSAQSGHAGIQFGTNVVTPYNVGTYSDADNTYDLGHSNVRWDDIYATNGTIQTSDRNEKQDIAELTDAEQRVAVAAKGLMRKFRWRDAVEAKGDDARTHFGIIAQDLQAAFAAEGLDAGDYAMFISSTWWEHDVEVSAVEAVAEVLDEEGNVVTEAVEAVDAYTRTDTYETQEEAPEGATERTRLGVRYSELLAFIIGAL
jgi:hypothetical protein